MKRALFATLALASPLSGDEVFLRGGGQVKGIVVERSESQVVVDVGAGRVGIPRGHVSRIVLGPTALASYNDRVSRLEAGDVEGWLDLALWARDQELLTQAREAFEHVVALDPSNATAQAALGRVLMGGAWLSAEEGYRARGYVAFEGSWVTPAERESILGQRRDEARAERARAEADARVREAEARARIAEAEAEKAEAQASVPEGGIPLGWGWGYGVPVATALPHRPLTKRPCHECTPQAPPAPRPVPSPRDPQPRREPKSGTAKIRR